MTISLKFFAAVGGGRP